MQGYILKTTPIKNQDLIVEILTLNAIKKMYRFYGLRHSIIHLGKKIDFEEENSGLFLPRLRNVIHLGYKWEMDFERTYIWQRFIQLLQKHLFDIFELDDFYFNTLETGAEKLLKQNPLRVGLEMYAEILNYEGRNDRGDKCFVCSETLSNEIVLSRAFLFAHPNCINGKPFFKDKILDFLNIQSSIHLDDEYIERMWEILLKGF